MGIETSAGSVRQVYVGSTPVKAVYVGSEKIWPTSEVYEVSLTDVRGSLTVHPLLTVTVPAGETWSVRIQGTVTKAPSSVFAPAFLIGDAMSQQYVQGAAVDFSGTITAADSTIAMGTASGSSYSSFTGTVTIEK